MRTHLHHGRCIHIIFICRQSVDFFCLFVFTIVSYSILILLTLLSTTFSSSVPFNTLLRKFSGQVQGRDDGVSILKNGAKSLFVGDCCLHLRKWIARSFCESIVVGSSTSSSSSALLSSSLPSKSYYR